MLAAAYVLRGVGDTTTSWLTWLSPLGWAEKTAPFGDQRWWMLAVPAVAGLASGGAAVWLAARRDVGSALLRGGAGPARATRLRRRPIGFAVWLHRPATAGWLAGGILLTAMMGALARQFLDALAGNSALGDAMGINGGRPLDGFVAVTQLYLAVIGAGYVIQAIGTLRAEEAEGRLETRLAGTLSRARWLAAHGAVIAAGLVLIVAGSSAVLALSTAWSVGNTDEIGAVMTRRPGLPTGGTGLRRPRPGRVRPVATRLRAHLGGVRRGDLHRLPRPRPEARTVGARPRSHHTRREPAAGNGRRRQPGRARRRRHRARAGRVRRLPPS